MALKGWVVKQNVGWAENLLRQDKVMDNNMSQR